MPKSSIDEVLRKLTFADLHDWVGETILNRGKNYVQRVDQLSRTADNTLVAWVDGSERYATSVEIDADGNFTDFCTCPYNWGPCKHAVAVILAAADHARSKKAIPPVDENDELCDALFGDSDEDEWIDDEWDDESVPASSPQRTQAQAKIGKMLSDRTRDELLDLLIDLSARIPEVRRHIVETEQLASGRVDKLVRALHSEIRELTAKPAWCNYWSGEGSLPDYSHLGERLRALCDQGHADAVLKLGAELWTKGNLQIEQSDDEGETAEAIASCLETVLAAMPHSSLSPPEQLLWMIDRMLEDEFSLLDSARKLLDRRHYTRAHWREVCATLETRLQAMPKPRTAEFSDRYHRERLLNLLLDTYGRAGWNDRVIPRLEDEADACQCYPRLVDALLAMGERERARHWCVDGYARTADDAPGIASALQERLRNLAQQERRHDRVSAYRAQDFFDAPSIANYRELRKAAEKAKCWPTIREAVLQYLETGRNPAASDQNGEGSAWPLPSPEVQRSSPKSRGYTRQFPDLRMLIDIAIAERRPDDVVALFQRLPRNKRRDRETDRTVAQAVANTHPDLALTIWREIVDGLIAQVKPKAYEEAAGYLRAMKKVYTRNQRVNEWQLLVNRLRTEHKAKRRLLGVLDSLERKKLVG